MKSLLIAATAAFAIASGGLAQAEEKPAATPQQMKMKTCNQDAKGLKGDERKKFMSGCLSNKGPKHMMNDTPPAERNAACAAKALDKNGKALAGAAHSSYMKKCMGE